MRGRVILLRGVSGSGKSTLVENIRGDREDTAFKVCSADFYFMKTGEYLFNPTKLPQAHQECFSLFLDALKNNVPLVVVDNTFIHLWEFDTYIGEAIRHGYLVEILEIQLITIAQLKECVQRNVHRVPSDVIARMALDFESAKNIYKNPNIKVREIPFVSVLSNRGKT